MRSNAGSTARNLRRMRFTCDVIVLSSTTMLASRISASRSLTWPGIARERVHHPELGQREVDALAVPVRGQALDVERERPALDDVLGRRRRRRAARCGGTAPRCARRGAAGSRPWSGSRRRRGAGPRRCRNRESRADRKMIGTRRRQRAQFAASARSRRRCRRPGRCRPARDRAAACGTPPARRRGSHTPRLRSRAGAARPRSWRGWRARPRRWRCGGSSSCAQSLGVGTRDPRASGNAHASNMRSVRTAGRPASLPPVCHISSPVCRFSRRPLAAMRARNAFHRGRVSRRAPSRKPARPPARIAANQGIGHGTRRSDRTATVSCAASGAQLGRLALESLGTGLVREPGAGARGVHRRVDSQRGDAAGDAGPGHAAAARGRRRAGRLRRCCLTDVHMDVSGMVARVQVTQRFVNPTARVARRRVRVSAAGEGRRRPPDDADRRARDRRADQGARARRAAPTRRRRPKAARRRWSSRSGRTCSRPASRTSGPDEEIVVAIEYQETLRYDDGAFRLRFPLAITPRYIPGDADRDGDGDGTRLVAPRRSRCRTPTASRRRSSTGTRRLRESGVDHDRPQRRISAGQRRQHLPRDATSRSVRATAIRLDARRRAGSRRARLRTGVDAGRRQRAGRGALHRDQGRQDVRAADGAAAVARRMPRRRARRARSPTSSTRRARWKACRSRRRATRCCMALDRLQPGDRFNVIEFNSTTHAAVHGARCRSTRRRSRRRSSSSAGCARAAAPKCCPRSRPRWPARRESSLMRQVVFLTDGAVGNEDAILRLRARRARRPAPVHDRHRPGAEHVLPDQGRAVRPRHVHVHRRRARGEGEDDRAVPQARKPGADRHRGRLARRRRRVAAAACPISTPASRSSSPRSSRRARCRATSRSPASRAGSAWQAAAAGRRHGATEPGVGVLWARAKIDALMDAGRQGAPESGHPRRRARRRAHAPPGQQVHEPGRGRRDADPARRDRHLKTAMPGNVPEGLTGFDQLPRTATPAALSARHRHVAVAGGRACGSLRRRRGARMPQGI